MGGAKGVPPVSTSVSQRWLAANAAGLFVGLPLSGFVADEIVDHDGPLNIPMHLVGFVALAAVLSYLQRRAIRPTRTPYWQWVGLQSIVLFLAFGLAFELLGPPVDFIA